MMSYVTDKIDVDAPRREPPLTVVALEAVAAPAAGDGPQRKVGQRLQDGEVRTRDRGDVLYVDAGDGLQRKVGQRLQDGEVRTRDRGDVLYVDAGGDMLCAGVPSS